jgi:hypothetical protein
MDVFGPGDLRRGVRVLVSAGDLEDFPQPTSKAFGTSVASGQNDPTISQETTDSCIFRGVRSLNVPVELLPSHHQSGVLAKIHP